MWNIRPTSNETFGVQQSLKEHLILRMNHRDIRNPKLQDIRPLQVGCPSF